MSRVAQEYSRGFFLEIKKKNKRIIDLGITNTTTDKNEVVFDEEELELTCNLWMRPLTFILNEVLSLTKRSDKESSKKEEEVYVVELGRVNISLFKELFSSESPGHFIQIKKPLSSRK